jgi:2-polyprenyl-3-methyl-5-hydroxy-6-metoxy-1,4-benzoquinol methylase
MKPFELFYSCVRPMLPALYTEVRRELWKTLNGNGKVPNVLDVGGRKSHYTIGLPANVHITDLARQSDLQKALNLGTNNDIARQIERRRSNVRWVLFDDMTNSSIRDNTFDCIVSVEVLEHVEKDADFVREVHRVLKPGGVFIMTTPNGDYVTKTAPDHKRHYKRKQLFDLLSANFGDVQVRYAIKGGKWRTWGLRAWSMRRPLKTVLSMVGNVVNSIESSDKKVGEQAHGTFNLVAVARKLR